MDTEEQRMEILRPYFGWEEQINFCKKSDALEPEMKNRAIDAFNFLRGFLGEGFPLKTLVNNIDAGHYFINNVPWTREWFIWLADACNNLRNGENFNPVLQHFCSADNKQFLEAETILNYGLKFKQEGFLVDFEQEVDNRDGGKKFPDLRLTDQVTGERIFCEITRLTQDARSLLYDTLSQRIIYGGICYGKTMLQYSGKLYTRIDNTKFNELMGEVEEKIAMAVRTGAMQEVNRSGILELAVSVYNDKMLAAWATEKGYGLNTFHYPLPDTFSRMINKIYKKSSQLAAGFPNLLIIKQEDGLFRHATPETWMKKLDETIFKSGEIMGVVISIHEFGGLEKKVVEFDTGYFVQRTERYALNSNSIIIMNKGYHGNQLQAETLEKLFRPFF